ncbi:MAG TPA: hypothetical protein PKL35_06080, partial [Methanoregulaceae archaeon]|nr:hypothetical protein [Methanoregulaceae archaeon]HOH81485.1 hypothetical protein [Methanoregulaceae archaeon]
MSSRKRKQEYVRTTGDRSREELIFATLSLPIETDTRVAGLVRVLNNLPDVYTCSSCGGHSDLRDRENPVPEGYFYVQFILEPTESGFFSLGIIDLAARNVDNENLAVKVLNCTDNPKLVMFHILGKEGVDPGEFAEEIRSLCKEWGVSCEGVYER